MYFDSGIHALSWLVNDSESLLTPATTTRSIMEMMRGVVPSSNFNYTTDDEHHARFDIDDLWGRIPENHSTLLMVFAIEGLEAAVVNIKTSRLWTNWRIKNKTALDKGSITYSGQLFMVLDDWESLLIANDYMCPFF